MYAGGASCPLSEFKVCAGTTADRREAPTRVIAAAPGTTARGEPLSQPALPGSIIVFIGEMRLAGNPPCSAWLRMSASLSAR
jgi:hypothetical protein